MNQPSPPDPEAKTNDRVDSAMRPQRLLDLVGQDKIKDSLAVLIANARKCEGTLDHILLCGPLGYGKSTLAHVMAKEMGVNIKITAGPKIERQGDLAGILTNLREGDVAFIDEIHCLGRAVARVLYRAMADFVLDLVVGKGSGARSIQLKLPRFTVIGAATRVAQVNERLISQMLVYDFTPYDVDDLARIIVFLAKQQGISIDTQAAKIVADGSHGSPGRAAILLTKVHKMAVTVADGNITPQIAKDSLSVFGSVEPLPVRGRLPIPDDAKIFVWQRDNGRCVICGSQENLEYDHIIPISKGGSNTARNIQLLCEKHNRSKGADLV